MAKRDWESLFKELPGYDPWATCGECTFNSATADNAVDFVESELRHIEGALAGKPLLLQPWQQAIIGCAFGWKRSDGTRRYREVFQFVPRKNGKTAMAAGVLNLVAFCDHEPGAQIYSAAADREQATLVYRTAKGMILQNPSLEQGVKIYSTYKSIEYPGNVVYKALSSDANTKHGFNSHFIVIDELHAHHDRELCDVLLTSTGSRRQPLVWYITTSDYDRDSICNEKYDYASKVRDGVIEDESFLPVIFEAAAADDWKSPAVWRKANPNLGVSISEDYLARECKRAQESPAYENTFKRLHLNIRTEQDVRLIPLEHWDNCTDERSPMVWREEMLEQMKGRECFAALDLSATTDISALSLVFTDENERIVLPWFWVPGDNAVLRERRDKVPYLTWARQGWIEQSEGNVIDYDVIRRKVNELQEVYSIRGIAIDRWNATQLATQLAGDGFEVNAFGQGYASMSAPTKELLSLVASGRLLHGGNPVLRWMAQNVAGEQDAAGNMKPSKKKSHERIDGIVSTIMALGLLMVNPEPSVYESRGLLTL